MVKMPSLEKKIREIFQEYFLDTYGETSEIYESDLKEKILGEFGVVAQQIQDRKQQLIKQLRKQPYPRTNIDSLIIEAGLGLLNWFSDLLVEKVEGEK